VISLLDDDDDDDDNDDDDDDGDDGDDGDSDVVILEEDPYPKPKIVISLLDDWLTD
jgi:hypothetical protein